MSRFGAGAARDYPIAAAAGDSARFAPRLEQCQCHRSPHCPRSKAAWIWTRWSGGFVKLCHRRTRSNQPPSLKEHQEDFFGLGVLGVLAVTFFAPKTACKPAMASGLRRTPSQLYTATKRHWRNVKVRPEGFGPLLGNAGSGQPFGGAPFVTAALFEDCGKIARLLRGMSVEAPARCRIRVYRDTVRIMPGPRRKLPTSMGKNLVAAEVPPRGGRLRQETRDSRR